MEAQSRGSSSGIYTSVIYKDFQWPPKTFHFLSRTYDRMMAIEEDRIHELFNADENYVHDELLVNDPYMKGPALSPSEIKLKKRKVELQKTVASFTFSFIFR